MAFIFKYSERSGTPACQFPDKIPQKIKEERNQILLKILEDQSKASNERLKNRKMNVLVETDARKGRGDLMGRTRCYRKVIFSAGRELIGKIVPVRIDQATSTILRVACFNLIPMSLFQYSFVTSLLLLTFGLTMWIRRSSICNDMLVFARSNKASALLLTISLAWFLFRYVQNLSEADFGNYKLIIGMVAVFIYFGSFALVKIFYQFVLYQFFVCFTHGKFWTQRGYRIHLQDCY